jgi:hypothetical protein
MQNNTATAPSPQKFWSRFVLTLKEELWVPVWKKISSPELIVTIALILMIVGGAISTAANNTMSEFILDKMALAFGGGLAFYVCYELVRTRLFKTDKLDLFKHGGTIALFLMIWPLLAQLYYGIFTYNWPDHKKANEVMLFDGQPVTDSRMHTWNPFVHDIQVIPYDASTDWYECTAMTKDGRQIISKIKVALRRTDDPSYWTMMKRMIPSRRAGIEARFKQICSAFTAREINNDDHFIEDELVRDGGLKAALPLAVQINGLIEVKETAAHPYIKE